MTYPLGTKQDIDYVQEDLDYIKSLLDKGVDVSGWINQNSKPNYAIGGGVVGNLSPAIDSLIQTTLSQYSKDYQFLKILLYKINTIEISITFITNKKTNFKWLKTNQFSFYLIIFVSKRCAMMQVDLPMI
ncbi:hypothetical protein [Mariniflexile sp. AS56]|uniref:hypothetical protein n=1 Tax=Mariniflexile sp. AS56 TaxID=3063957 RepID=UPI0026F16745|nr:hypothetical protein [Mariniflexile sp. AS56]MDO7172623.1 hypothetical protein [Mariniflexile sp. AS56]